MKPDASHPGLTRCIAWIASAYLLLWLTAVAGIAAYCFVAAPDGDGLVPRFHLTVLGGAFLALGLAESMAIYLLRRSPHPLGWISWLFGLLLGSVHLVMAVYYICLVFGMQSWGDVITQDFVAGFLREAPAMIGNLPFSLVPVFAASGLAATLMMVLHVYLAHRRVAAWRTAFLGWPAGLSVSMLKTWTPAVVLPGLMISIPWMAHVEDAVFYREPLVSLIRNQTWRDATGARKQNAADEQSHMEARKSYALPVPGPRRHVVLIVLDAPRLDRMSAYGAARPTTPFLDSLLQSGSAMSLKQAYSPCANTACGVGALLQSQLPHRLVQNGFGLPDALSVAGYRTVFVLTGNHTGFFSLRRYYGSKPDYFIDGSTRDANIASDDEQVVQTLAELGLNPEQPTFLMIHLMSSHVAGTKHPQFRRYTPDTATITDPHEVKTVAYTNNHDNGLLQTDDYLRRIFAILKSRGLLQDALVIITGDHGESMGEKGIFMHSQSVYEQEIRVPIFIVDKDLSRYQRSVNVSLIDIAPTVVDRLGLPKPGIWKGESLLAPVRRQWTTHQMGLYHGLIEWDEAGAGLKLIYRSRDRKAELYDLKSDPGETRDLFEQRRPDASRMMLRLAMEVGMVVPSEPFDKSVSDFVWK